MEGLDVRTPSPCQNTMTLITSQAVLQDIDYIYAVLHICIQFVNTRHCKEMHACSLKVTIADCIETSGYR